GRTKSLPGSVSGSRRREHPLAAEVRRRANHRVRAEGVEAQIIIEEWRKHFNTERPHSALGYRPPAP
ncbi:MAG: integrase core domain-containing protein, partial [Acidobacteriota bacterium]